MQTNALSAWTSGIVSDSGVMNREIEFRLGTFSVVVLKNKTNVDQYSSNKNGKNSCV
jgi:hypothetical protein